MKKILTTALAVVLFVGASQAQDKGRKHDQHGARIGKELGLTEEQKTKQKSIREAQHAEMKQLMSNDKITVGDMKAQRKAIHEKYKTQLESVLTPAQKETFEKNKGQWREGRGKGFGKKEGQFGHGPKIGKQAAFLKKELNLSPDQETRLKGLFEEFKTKAKGVRTNSALTPEQKKQQVQTLAKQYMDQGKTILNAEQLKKFEEMKSKRKDRLNRNS